MLNVERRDSHSSQLYFFSVSHSHSCLHTFCVCQFIANATVHVSGSLHVSTALSLCLCLSLSTCKHLHTMCLMLYEYPVPHIHSLTHTSNFLQGDRYTKHINKHVNVSNYGDGVLRYFEDTGTEKICGVELNEPKVGQLQRRKKKKKKEARYVLEQSGRLTHTSMLSCNHVGTKRF